MQWDRLWVNCHLATMAGATPFGAIQNGAIGVHAGRIAWIGRRQDLAAAPAQLARECIDLHGAWLTPGLIDAHTHLAFAGDRSQEFEQRLQGASYAEIARAGGGIRASVAAIRAITLPQLVQLTCERAARLATYGVTTVEIKSGYGLSLESERKQLQAARSVGERLSLRVRTSFLGAHAVPAECSREQYLTSLVSTMLPTLAAEGLVDAVDAFCDQIGFSAAELEPLLETARRLQLPVKLHADQLSDAGAAGLAARYGALSADHVEYSNAGGIAAMAAAGTVALLLPAAFYYLGETRRPPIELFRSLGVPLALASDCNPGTAPILHPGIIMNMGCVLFGLTPAEALAGYTREAARALGLQAETGTLECGKSADFAIWDCSNPAQLCYWIDGMQPVGRVFRGEVTPLPIAPGA